MAYDNNYGYAQNGYTQYLDQNGKPLTGGSIETYIAGTTTPVLTFKDFNGGQNPHKITLDENGGATIILRQDTVYKFIIRDKNGDIFKTIDNIISSGNTTIVGGDDVKISGKEGEIVVDYFANTKEYSIKLDDRIIAKLDEKEVFFCRYNNTSYNDIRDAYNAGKLIIMYKSQYNLYEYFLLDARDPHAFQFKKVEKDRITFYTIDEENGWRESYQNYEVDAQIPIASESVLGGIKVGQNLTIDSDGTLNAQGGGGGTSDNDLVLPYETATYAQINGYAQNGKQVVIYYAGVDDDQFWTLSHKTAEHSYVFTWINGNSLVKMTLSSGNVWSEEVIGLKIIKDNAYDSVTDPADPDNITEVQELTFFRNVGEDLKQTLVTAGERIYGVLIPSPSREADQGKVPMLNNLGQIVWALVPDEEFIDDAISSAVLNLQTKLTFDTTPTADSTNPVTSGGIKAALNGKQDAFTIIAANTSITGTTATVNIEQGDLCIVDLSEETSLTAIEIVLTNNDSVAFPLWWFKIESGSTVTLSVKIGATSVGWIGSAIANIAMGKTIEVSVVDGIACGGEVL